MKICILCKDEDVNAARENTRKIFGTKPKNFVSPFLKEDKVVTDFLSIPVSQNGEMPATHWFCFMNTSEDGFQKIKNNNIYSIIEESGPKEFLEKFGLVIIKKD